MDGWNTIVSFLGPGLFSGATLLLGSGGVNFWIFKTSDSQIPKTKSGFFLLESQSAFQFPKRSVYGDKKAGLIKGNQSQMHHVWNIPWKINGWNLRVTHLERNMIFQSSMILFHMNLEGCIYLHLAWIYGNGKCRQLPVGAWAFWTDQWQQSSVCKSSSDQDRGSLLYCI